MDRRSFIQHATVASAAAALPLSAAQAALTEHKEGPYQLKFAPHLGMFEQHAGKGEVDQLNFMADMGFHGFEDNGMKGRSVATQEAMAKTMANRGITMGVFVAHTIYWDKPNLANGDAELREKFLQEVKESVEVAKRVNAKWMTVVPGHVDMRLDMGYQTANVVEALRRAADILEPHNLVMVLEPLNFRDHPGQFLSRAGQAYEVCRAVDSPSCKILFDIYHQQITEGNLIPNIDLAWSEIAYFQIGDNPAGKEPTTGEVNYANVFRHIHEKGFRGVYGMEHGNSKSGKEGELAVMAAYRSVDLQG